MARVTAELPPLLADPDALVTALQDGARQAMDAELPTVLTEIVQEGLVPRNTGVLQRAVLGAAQPARVEGSQVIAELVAGGEASQYAAVQDLGRRAGKPMSWRVLYYGPGARGLADGWKSGWVNRKMRDAVEEIAASLAAQDEAEGSARGQAKASRKKARTQGYERRACYILAVSIAAKIRARGMPGKGFLDGQRKRIGERVQTMVNAEIGRVLRRLGLGGDA